MEERGCLRNIADDTQRMANERVPEEDSKRKAIISARQERKLIKSYLNNLRISFYSEISFIKEFKNHNIYNYIIQQN